MPTSPPTRASSADRLPLVAVATQFWINGMVYASIVPRLPELRDRLSIDVATLGLVLTLSAVGGLVGSAVSGPAIARLGTKRAIVVGTLATLGLLPVVGVVRSAVTLTVVLALLALFDVVIDIAMNLQGSRLSARRRTPVMNRLHGLWSLGTVVGGLVAVRAASSGLSILASLIGTAVVLLVVFVAVGRYLLASDRPGPDDVGEWAADPDEDAGPGARTDGEAAAAGRRAAITVAVVLAVLAAAAIMMEMISGDWAAFRLADDLGVAPGREGWGFVAFTAGMVTGRFAGDTVQAALGDRRLVQAAASLAGLGLAVATLTPIEFAERLLGADGPLLITVAGFYTAALGVSVVFPRLYDQAATAPGPPGFGLSALTAGTRAAVLAAPVVVGLLADSRLSVGAAIAIVTLPSCLLMFLAAGREPSDRSPGVRAAD